MLLLLITIILIIYSKDSDFTEIYHHKICIYSEIYHHKFDINTKKHHRNQSKLVRVNPVFYLNKAMFKIINLYLSDV